jgi:hypothetical protein
MSHLNEELTTCELTQLHFHDRVTSHCIEGHHLVCLADYAGQHCKCHCHFAQRYGVGKIRFADSFPGTVVIGVDPGNPPGLVIYDEVVAMSQEDLIRMFERMRIVNARLEEEGD